jgi:DNA modification methylase
MPEWTVVQGDCIEVMKSIKDESIDAIVTDPPYGLEFMGKDWDGADGFRRSLNGADVGRESVFGRMSARAPEYRAGNSFQAFSEAWARETLRILKPGGHLLAFGGTRTYHRLACAIEDAGFEIRDSIDWIYGQGFPKSLDISKAIDKMLGGEREVIGTTKGSGMTKSNVDQGAQQRFTTEWSITSSDPATPEAARFSGWGTALKPAHETVVVARKPVIGTVAENVLEHGTGGINVDGCRVGRSIGRWPPNIVLTHAPGCEEECDPSCPVAMMDAQSGETKSTDRPRHNKARENVFFGQCDKVDRVTGGFTDVGGASRFFPTFEWSEFDFLYCAKASKRDRGEGNNHPCVKPITFMRWLVRLVTPAGGIVLDPFLGSGTTGVAARLEGFHFLGVEREESYVVIAMRRIESTHP